METCNVVLTFESVDEILWCDHSNETSLAVHLHGTICFSIFCKTKFGFFYLDFWRSWKLKGLKNTSLYDRFTKYNTLPYHHSVFL